MNDALPVTDDSWMVWECLIIRLEEHTHYITESFESFQLGEFEKNLTLVTYLKNMFLEKCLQLGYILTQFCNAEGESAEGESGLNES